MSSAEVDAMALAAQAGQADQLEPLWNSQRRLVYKIANSLSGQAAQCGYDVDDLVQESYFAFLDAVAAYTPEQGSFSALLATLIRRRFIRLTAEETTTRKPLNQALSLDAPVQGSEGDDLTLGDTVEAPDSAFESVENEVYRQQLRTALERALERIPEAQATAVRGCCLDELSAETVAAQRGTDPARVKQLKRAGIQALRSRCAALGLEQLLEERTDYVSGVGLRRFQRTGVAPVEREVLRREALTRSFLKGRSGGAVKSTA